MKARMQVNPVAAAIRACTRSIRFELITNDLADGLGILKRIKKEDFVVGRNDSAKETQRHEDER
jgi:hypothetical protein